MNNILRFVADTNVIVSRLLFPNSLPGLAFRKAIEDGIALASDDTLAELSEVLSRPKFDAYLTSEERQMFLHQFLSIVEVVDHVLPLKFCRDPKDDKFLSLSKSGEASLILTGDEDLLVLNPFEKIRIISPAHFLKNPHGH